MVFARLVIRVVQLSNWQVMVDVVDSGEEECRPR
jgi:hypothetical protein